MFARGRAYREFIAGLAGQLRAGIPVRQAFQNLAAKGSYFEWSEKARVAIDRGATLADALRESIETASPDHLVLIAAGERSGRVVEMLDTLYERLKAEAETRSWLLGRLAYPACLYVGLLTVVPLFLLVSGRPLAYFGVLLLGMAPLALIGLAWITRDRWVPRGSAVRASVQSWLLGVPFVGAAIRDRVLARVLSLLSLLIESGLGWSESLDSARGTTGWNFVDEDLSLAARWIRGGAKASEALAKLRGLSPETVAALAAGELAGELDRTLSHAAEVCRDVSDARLSAIVRAVPFVVLALVAAGILAAGVYAIRRYFEAAGF